MLYNLQLIPWDAFSASTDQFHASYIYIFGSIVKHLTGALIYTWQEAIA